MRKRLRKFTAIIGKEGKWYVALCPELDVASQGRTLDKSLANLKEAIRLYLEEADPRELARLRHPLITTLEIAA